MIRVGMPETGGARHAARIVRSHGGVYPASLTSLTAFSARSPSSRFVSRMFEQLRDSLRALSDRLAPEERRRVVSAMRDAMVHAKLGLQDLRDGIASTQARLTTERAELDTVRRRQGLAAQIGDNETVAIAEKFANQHAERVSVLESKLMVQQQELTLAERELEEMSSQLRMAASGIAPGGVSADVSAQREVDAFLSGSAGGIDDDGAARGGFGAGAGSSGTMGGAAADAAPLRRTRAEKEAEAEERLAALKRRMGK